MANYTQLTAPDYPQDVETWCPYATEVFAIYRYGGQLSPRRGGASFATLMSSGRFSPGS
jgi:hypothetical protein